MGKMKTTEEFKEEVANIDDGIWEVLDEYQGSKTKIRLLNTLTGEIYFTKPNNLLLGYRPKKKKVTEEERKETKRKYYYANREKTLEEGKNYSRSFVGMVTEYYSRQKQRSKLRGHPNPNYTKEWLTNWLESNDEFWVLYENWKENNYEQRLKPSIDRINSDLPYRKDNIQITTVSQNSVNANKERKSKAVVQLTLDGEYVDEWISARECERCTEFRQSGVSRCCNGKQQVYMGFIFKYKEDYYGKD